LTFSIDRERFEKCSISRKAKILTADMHQVFRGFKSESDAEIGKRGRFSKRSQWTSISTW
jgi:hypothetical protein